MNEEYNSKVLECPICHKKFDNIYSYAAHVNEHLETEKKAKTLAEREAKAKKQKEDIANLEKLKDELVLAENRFNEALKTYRETYGGLVFPYDYIDDGLFNHIVSMFQLGGK